jgi:hypothetical protein
MARVARRVDDRRVLKLIRGYLNAGVMADGVRRPSEQGTPQGSPLSPLLSNVYLDDPDRELGRRGHRSVRYADEVMIYVQGGRAGQRVIGSVCTFIEQRLKLKVSRDKAAVAWAGRRTFLGFSFYKRKHGWKIGVGRDAPKRAKRRLRQLTARTWGVPMERRIDTINRFTRGWTAYFSLAEGERPFRDLDEWLRRRMRQVRWKEWKRYSARRRNLRALGAPERSAREWAATRKGPWRVAGSWVLSRTLTDAYWQQQGLLGFTHPYRRLRDRQANRPVRTRTPGGVGGAGVSPAPTRLKARSPLRASSRSPLRGRASPEAISPPLSSSASKVRALLLDDPQQPPCVEYADMDLSRWMASDRPQPVWRPTTTRYSAFISRRPSPASLRRSAIPTISARQSSQRPSALRRSRALSVGP